MRSMWLTPLRHPRHVPYCSRLASMPHDLYVLMTQSLACVPCGVPVRRGPIESKKVCARSQVCELSMPSVHMRLSTGSFVEVCAATLRHGAASSTLNAKKRVRVMRALRLRIREVWGVDEAGRCVSA